MYFIQTDYWRSHESWPSLFTSFQRLIVNVRYLSMKGVEIVLTVFDVDQWVLLQMTFQSSLPEPPPPPARKEKNKNNVKIHIHTSVRKWNKQWPL